MIVIWNAASLLVSNQGYPGVLDTAFSPSQVLTASVTVAETK